ncbi:MAG: chlorophyll synthesis pathway protein BchC [Hyphomonadaceae bacterium]|nr:chlorophyll synthesis pathway protein BchC [Hyphomonadaceae bacterium]
MIYSADSVSDAAAKGASSPTALSRDTALQSDAILFSGQKQVDVRTLGLKPLEEGDLIVDVAWSGISTGTERLLWSGEMPPFPGLAYPLVPGYEAVGRVVHSEGDMDWLGAHVFVPGSSCFEDASGLFGASASRLVVPEARAIRLDHSARESDVLLALAATAHHAVTKTDLPELIIGHGVLGQLAARLVGALGGDAPTVWEINPARLAAEGYPVIDPAEETRRDYSRVCDMSGSVAVLDTAIAHAAKGAEIVLAGFYSDRVSFEFPAAFMREISFKIAAEWTPADIDAVLTLQRKNLLSLEGLVTHIESPGQAEHAYQTAFSQAACLKMVLDWRGYHDHLA